MITARSAIVECDWPDCVAIELIDLRRDGRGWTDAQVGEDLAKFGWSTFGGVHYCPKHTIHRGQNACIEAKKDVS